jgi:predicted nucleic acid-binding protein
MDPVFADTFYWIALSNAKDEWHEEAKRPSAALAPRRFTTTEKVLAEYLTSFASAGDRV